MTTKWRHFLANGFVAAGFGLVTFGLMGVTGTRADETHGTIKIHVEAACADENNEPKVGAEFWISGSGFDVGIELFLAVTDGVNASDPIIIGPVSVGSTGNFCAGPYSLTADGHYKIYVGHEGANILVNHEKTKVFKTEAAITTTIPDTTVPAVTTTTEVDSGGPTSTTTSVASAGPTTTNGTLPTTGQAPGALLVLGLGLAAIGVTMRVLTRRVS